MPRISPLWSVIAAIAVPGTPSWAAPPGAPVLYERPIEVATSTAYLEPIATLEPRDVKGTVVWLPQGWDASRLAEGVFEAKGPGQAVIQVVVHGPKINGDRSLARICRKPKHTGYAPEQDDLTCADGATAHRAVQYREVIEGGRATGRYAPVVTVTGVMVDHRLVERLAALAVMASEAQSHDAGASPVTAPAAGAAEIKGAATVALPGPGWRVSLPTLKADEPEQTRYALAQWGVDGGRAAVIAQRVAYTLRGQVNVGDAKAVVAVTAADTPCPGEISRTDHRTTYGDADRLLDSTTLAVLNVVAPAVFDGHQLAVELCLPISPGSVWLGVSVAGGQAGTPGAYVERANALRPVLIAVIQGILRGALADAKAGRAHIYGAAPDQAGRVVTAARFNAVIASPAEKARPPAPARRAPPPGEDCRALIVAMALAAGAKVPHACAGSRDEQRVFAEAWYARRAAEGWPGVYSFGAWSAQVTERGPLQGELALVGAMVALARAGGFGDVGAIRQYGKALEDVADRYPVARRDELRARGAAWATLQVGATAAGGVDASASGTSVAEINQRVSDYYKQLSRVGKGCTGVGACEAQARRDALEALRNQR